MPPAWELELHTRGPPPRALLEKEGTASDVQSTTRVPGRRCIAMAISPRPPSGIRGACEREGVYADVLQENPKCARRLRSDDIGKGDFEMVDVLLSVGPQVQRYPEETSEEFQEIDAGDTEPRLPRASTQSWFGPFPGTFHSKRDTETEETRHENLPGDARANEDEGTRLKRNMKSIRPKKNGMKTFMGTHSQMKSREFA